MDALRIPVSVGAWWVVATCGAPLIQGCAARLDETYYLAAFDPTTGADNYFRIRLRGSSFFSRAKHSVGFYDRDAVERLFGEQSLEQEYLSASIDMFDDLGKRLRDLSAKLASARTALGQRRRDDLERANAAVAALIGEYDTRLMMRGPEIAGLFAPALARAKQAREAGETALNDGTPAGLNSAMAKLSEAHAIMETIRVAVDGRVLVRFFDGAGNEIDAKTKTQVIFVATDASRFAEAIRQLAEEEAATHHLIQALLGRRIKEARLLAKRAASDDALEAALIKRMDEIVAGVPETPTADQMKAAIDEISLVIGPRSVSGEPDESIGGAP